MTIQSFAESGLCGLVGALCLCAAYVCLCLHVVMTKADKVNYHDIN